MSNRVPAADAQVRRVEIETTYADRWRRLCDPETTGVPISELAAHHLGLPRPKLYESFEAGQRHPRAAWVELLPPQAQVVYLRERALAHGYELAPAGEEHATLSEVVSVLGRALTSSADALADGHLSAAEARSLLMAVRMAKTEIAKLETMCNAAIEHRGLTVAK